MPTNLDAAAKVRVFTRRVRDTATGFSLRLSARFMHPKFKLLKEQHLSEAQTVPLKSFCARPINRGVQPEYDESDVFVAKTGTLKNGYLDWTDAQSVTEEFYNAAKFRAGLVKGDILISSTGVGSLGKVDYFDGSKHAMADGHISIFRAASSGSYDPELLVYLLRSRVVQWQIEQGLTGATNQIDIYPSQLEQLRIPILAEKLRKGLLAKIVELERGISKSRAVLRRDVDVINKILCHEFAYPLKEHMERSKITSFALPLSGVAASYTLRNSTKYHQPEIKLTSHFFEEMAHLPIRALLARPPVLGAQISPTNFDEDGIHFYLTPAAIKGGHLNPEALRGITAEFFEQHQWRLGLARNDVVLGASGEGLGKVGVYDSDEQSIISQFIMRLRLDGSQNAEFVAYFMRSVMFQSQIKREKRGINIPNIFPPEVERMLIVDCDRDRQDEIAKAITKELTKLAAHRAAIETKRQEVVALIEGAISQAREEAVPT